jgi:hypothetical protein
MWASVLRNQLEEIFVGTVRIICKHFKIFIARRKSSPLLNIFLLAKKKGGQKLEIKTKKIGQVGHTNDDMTF